MDIVHPQERMMESDYIVMPRSSVNTQPTMKEESKMNIGMETLPHERLLHYKVNPEFSMNPPVMDQFNMNLDQHLAPQEHMQSLPFEPRTAVKNFMASELDDNTGLSRSETGSTISMSSLEVSHRNEPVPWYLKCIQANSHNVGVRKIRASFGGVSDTRILRSWT